MHLTARLFVSFSGFSKQTTIIIVSIMSCVNFTIQAICDVFSVRYETIFIYYSDQFRLLPDLLGLPLSWHKFWDDSQVPSCYCMLLMQHSRLKLLEINPPLLQRPTNYLFKLHILALTVRSKFYGHHIKLILLAILTSSFSCYSCQENDSAKPGNLLTKRCSVCPPYIKFL